MSKRYFLIVYTILLSFDVMGISDSKVYNLTMDYVKKSSEEFFHIKTNRKVEGRNGITLKGDKLIDNGKVVCDLNSINTDIKSSYCKYKFLELKRNVMVGYRIRMYGLSKFSGERSGYKINYENVNYFFHPKEEARFTANVSEKYFLDKALSDLKFKKDFDVFKKCLEKGGNCSADRSYRYYIQFTSEMAFLFKQLNFQLDHRYELTKACMNIDYKTRGMYLYHDKENEVITLENGFLGSEATRENKEILDISIMCKLKISKNKDGKTQFDLVFGKP
ncbi:hypothetical protein [Halobacteriovorax sp. ZH4_bin.1]|uniref:hypothetical protein n=1 Tax=unclassified Halobacteriovorax TaxID=2639665 RepID=UPI003717DA42